MKAATIVSQKDPPHSAPAFGAASLSESYGFSLLGAADCVSEDLVKAKH